MPQLTSKGQGRTIPPSAQKNEAQSHLGMALIMVLPCVMGPFSHGTAHVLSVLL